MCSRMDSGQQFWWSDRKKQYPPVPKINEEQHINDKSTEGTAEKLDNQKSFNQPLTPS